LTWALESSVSKCVLRGDSCSLITQKQLFDFVRGGNRDGTQS